MADEDLQAELARLKAFVLFSIAHERRAAPESIPRRLHSLVSGRAAQMRDE